MVDISNSWETDIASLLGSLSDVQRDLLSVLAEKRRVLATGDIPGINAIAAREAELIPRLQACQDRRQELLSRAADDGLPADSIRSLAAAIAIERPRTLAGRRAASSESLAISRKRVSDELGASTADAVTSVPIDRDYCYRRAAEADIWKWLRAPRQRLLGGSGRISVAGGHAFSSIESPAALRAVTARFSSRPARRRVQTLQIRSVTRDVSVWLNSTRREYAAGDANRSAGDGQ